jgi:hypothetical protein
VACSVVTPVVSRLRFSSPVAREANTYIVVFAHIPGIPSPDTLSVRDQVRHTVCGCHKVNVDKRRSSVACFQNRIDDATQQDRGDQQQIQDSGVRATAPVIGNN